MAKRNLDTEATTKPPDVHVMRPRREKRKLSWGDVSSAALHEFVKHVTDDGSAVLFGRTLDEATLSVLVLAGKDKIRRYMSNLADVEPELEDVMYELDILP